MEKEKLDIILVIAPQNIHWLIGTRAKSFQEFQCLFFTREPGPLTMLMRLAEVLEYTEQSLAKDIRGWGGREPEDPIDVVKSIMEEKGYFKLRVGLEVPYYYLGPYDYIKLKGLLKDCLVKEVPFLIEDLKLAKSAAEIAYIRKASKIADAAFQTGLESIAAGKTELEIAGEMHRTLMVLGSDASASPMNFVSGERIVYPHGFPTERKLKQGDDINIEYAGCYKRYHCTIGRQLCLGKPRPRVKEVYKVVREACDACIAAIKAGVLMLKPHEAAKKVIADAGMDQYRLHTTGYGIGPGYPPSWGENNHLFGDSKYILEAGMVVSIEPPIYINAERVGVRIIDDVLVTKTGAEILSETSRDLIEL
jgi:Xaa-Pro dipeptidase